MKTLHKSLLLALGTLALAGTSFAQVPSTNDTSDPTLHNTGGGSGALNYITTGGYNTAYGDSALNRNTTGDGNAAVGVNALLENTSGQGNSAFGADTLYSNTTGSNNTASGSDALNNNKTGNYNTAVGESALVENTTADSNTGVGYLVLAQNMVGVSNTAVGAEALESSTGSYNTAFGTNALHVNRAGGGNTALGYGTLAANRGGHYNIADGFQAGNQVTGSYNIDVGNVGVAADSGVIRIGTSGQQTEMFIAGIANNTSVSGPYVVIDTTTGQLGVTTTPPPAGVKTAYVPSLQKEVRRQAVEIRDLKQQQLQTLQQVAELKTLNEATRVALQKLQAKDELMAQR